MASEVLDLPRFTEYLFHDEAIVAYRVGSAYRNIRRRKFCEPLAVQHVDGRVGRVSPESIYAGVLLATQLLKIC